MASEVFSAVGLISLAFLPRILPSAYAGIMISVVLYAVGSGLIEVLCSPIVEACPFENKEATMSLLHSFYCWGWVGVTIISTLLFTLIGIDKWPLVACFWAIIPLYNIYNFATCPIEHLVDEGKGITILQLFKSPLFWIAVVLMVCSGASEISMAQWASAFVESGLGFSKTVCDLAGPCLFGITMGICRTKHRRNDFSKSWRQFAVRTFLWRNLPGCVGSVPDYFEDDEREGIERKLETK